MVNIEFDEKRGIVTLIPSSILQSDGVTKQAEVGVATFTFKALEDAKAWMLS